MAGDPAPLKRIATVMTVSGFPAFRALGFRTLKLHITFIEFYIE
jgi:hypothetical protein